MSLSAPSKAQKLSTFELAVYAMLAALMFCSKLIMEALPNIHLVAVFVILAALLFGWKSLISIYIFALLEGLVYGFGIWFVNYLYVWTILAVIAILLRKNKSKVFWASIAGIFGLLFGALCSIPHYFIGGWAGMFAYWIAGIPFDLIHCVSNAVLTFVLLMPLYDLCTKIMQKNKQYRK